MGGTLEVKSQLNYGSEFFFTLPMTAKACRRTRLGEVLKNQHPNWRKHHALVVSDIDCVRNSIARLVQCYGVRVDTCNFSTLKQQDFSYFGGDQDSIDLVVISENDPDSWSLAQAFIRFLQLQSDMHTLPVIYITHSSKEELSAEHLHITSLLLQPVSQAQLQFSLEQILGIEMESDTVPQTENKLRNDSAVNLRGRHVLIAEDDPINQSLIEAIMAEAGIVFSIVDNGQLALEALGQSTYDIILMDMQMPVMDGYEAANKILKWQKSKEIINTPIIALSAHAMDRHRQMAFDAGMVDYITKPITYEQLHNKLARYLDLPEPA